MQVAHAFRHPVALASLAVAATLAGTARAAPLPLYDVAELPQVPGAGVSFDPLAVNDRGMVAGTGKRRADSKVGTTIFAWQGHAGAMGGVGLDGSRGLGVALDGTVVGTTSSGLPQGFTWNESGRTILVDQGTAVGVTPDGTVVGTDYLAGAPYTWTDGTMTSLGVPAGYGSTYADAISTDGLQVLAHGLADGHGQYSDLLVYRDGAWTVLGTFGSAAAVGMGINTSGTAVGYVWDYVDDGEHKNIVYRGLVVKDGQGRKFGSKTPAYDSEARGVNDAEFVVGFEEIDNNGSPVQVAVVITPAGTLYDMNTLLAPGSGDWILLNADAINRQGQVVGFGLHDGRRVAFIATPQH
jgi:hypothetical protein